MAWQFTAHAPVYMQIVSRIRADILTGVYQADEQIPTVRQLALEAGVNPNTMQRAFAVLEAEHLFVTRGTVGRFITTDTAVLENARRILKEETIERLILEARAVGIEPEELIRCIRTHTEQNAPASPIDNQPSTDCERSDSPS